MWFKKSTSKHSPAGIHIIKEASEMLSRVIGIVVASCVEGIETKELDIIAEKEIRKMGAIPAFLNYRGYPSTLCVSINNIVVHGIPDKYRLKKGDIVSIDCGIKYQGYYSDMAVTIPVGEIDQLSLRLIKDTYKALALAIEKLKNGVYTGDIGNLIYTYGVSRGYGVVTEFCGHGIGKNLHQEPQIHNFGNPGQGTRLTAGMVICVEPMFTAGSGKVCVLPDGWSVSTIDGSNSAHFEHTVLIEEDKAIPLTTFSYLPEWAKDIILK